MNVYLQIFHDKILPALISLDACISTNILAKTLTSANYPKLEVAFEKSINKENIT